MDDRTITLPSGRTLAVAVAPLLAAGKLRRACAAELARVDIQSVRIDPALDLRNLSNLAKMDPLAVNTVKNLFCAFLASEAVESAMFECAARCTIDGQKVDRQSFERPETRGDLIPVAGEVIRANLGPFFTSLGLSSSTPAEDPNTAQR